MVIEQHSIPVYEQDWGADEELCLLEGAEVYGLGSWADIADHIGGYRDKDEVRDHYIKTYIDSPNFPLPANADPGDKRLSEQIPIEEFQARKKRRIEERREAAKSAPPATPKQKPTASVPACHEVQGYMPGRLEFETEYANDAEEAVQNLSFDPGDGLNPRTGEIEPEMEFKMVVMDIYNSRLTARADRKKVVFEHNLLEYKKLQFIERKKTKEEVALANKAKPFARMMNHEDFEAFTGTLEFEHNLRQAIAQLQDWRKMRIGDLKTGEKYEQEKQARAARPAPTGVFDRQVGVRPEKKTDKDADKKAVVTVELTAPELPERFRPTPPAPVAPPSANGTLTNGAHPKGPLTNGTTNATLPPPQEKRTRYVVQAPSSISSLKLTSEIATDVHLLTKEEVELCSAIRVMPKPYLAMKEAIVLEAMKNGGALKRKTVRDICKVCFRESSRL
jgi:transcriptional adapter 2-alpha